MYPDFYDTNIYDILLGLDFLIKIAAIMDVERSLIQIKHGLRANVEVLPLTMVNMLQNMSSEAMMRDVTIALENTQITNGSNPSIKIPYQHNSIIRKGVDDHVSNSDIDTNNNEHSDEGFHQVEHIGDESEFWGTEFEDLVLLKGPQQILHLTQQEQADGFMEEV